MSTPSVSSAHPQIRRCGNLAAVIVALVVAGCGTSGADRTARRLAPAPEQPAVTSLDFRGARRVEIQVWLRPDIAAAAAFATAVSTPGNPDYRHFLAPDVYAAHFGPGARRTTVVADWLRSRGFSSLAVDAQRDDIRAIASPGEIDAAFGATTARGDEQDASLQSAPPELRVPRPLTRDVIAVDEDGNGSADRVAALEQSTPRVETFAAQGSCSRFYGQRTEPGLPAAFGTTRFPLQTCGLDAHQLRTAYGADASNAGTGETIVLAEAGGLAPNGFQALRDYARRNGLPAPSAARFKTLNLQPAACSKAQESTGEQEMDVESAYALAPRASELVVGADLCDVGDRTEGIYQPGLDMDQAIIDGNGEAPLGSIVANTWETGFDGQPRALDGIETAILVKAAAVGVGMYYAAGDQGCVTQPAANPYATGVGGTDLEVNRAGHRLFETGGEETVERIEDHAWHPLYDYSTGGGLSDSYHQPGYQRGIVPRTMSIAHITARAPGHGSACETPGHAYPHATDSPRRIAPDVAADALDNFEGGKIVHGHYVPFLDAGTSLSAPLVAAMVADAQQGRTTPYGFINPALYGLAGSSAFYDPSSLSAQDPVSWRALLCPQTNIYCGGASRLWLLGRQRPATHDDSGQTSVKGYDTTTGLGVPNGQAFIRAMRRLR